jgi:hypothetical protein
MSIRQSPCHFSKALWFGLLCARSASLPVDWQFRCSTRGHDCVDFQIVRVNLKHRTGRSHYVSVSCSHTAARLADSDVSYPQTFESLARERRLLEKFSNSVTMHSPGSTPYVNVFGRSLVHYFLNALAKTSEMSCSNRCSITYLKFQQHALWLPLSTDLIWYGGFGFWQNG